MKLELKHLAGYLPYGLKWSLQELKTFEMQGITPTTLYTKEGTVLNWEKHPDLPQALFPILRPLSDLTKEIEVNGEKFVPSKKLGFTDENIGDFHTSFAPYFIIKLLLEWHFDIFSLIENGLAIDINTI